jgi:hypothetical protein
MFRTGSPTVVPEVRLELTRPFGQWRLSPAGPGSVSPLRRAVVGDRVAGYRSEGTAERSVIYAHDHTQRAWLAGIPKSVNLGLICHTAGAGHLQVSTSPSSRSVSVPYGTDRNSAMMASAIAPASCLSMKVGHGMDSSGEGAGSSGGHPSQPRRVVRAAPAGPILSPEPPRKRQRSSDETPDRVPNVEPVRVGITDAYTGQVPNHGAPVVSSHRWSDHGFAIPRTKHAPRSGARQLHGSVDPSHHRPPETLQ